MTDEEIQALQTELESTRTELEGIKAERETLINDLEARSASNIALEQELADKVVENESLSASITELEQKVADKQSETQRIIDDLTDSFTKAVFAYKTAISQANPGVPGELITGDTIEAIDQSLESAKSLVAQVRSTLEAEIAAGKVPAGAPARTPPDLSALSPREKIQYGIGGNK
jgi:chromosome segregation ATPase